jgi:hypothetical protein
VRFSPSRLVPLLTLAAAVFAAVPVAPAGADASPEPATAVGVTPNGNRVVRFDTASGAELRTLADLPADEWAFPVALAPDGTVFVGTGTEGGARRIFRAADDKAPELIATSAYTPAVSPDGRFLAYGYDSSENPDCTSHGLALRELATGAERRLHYTEDEDGRCDNDATGLLAITWAPDSRRLAFDVDDSGGEIFLLDTASAHSLADATTLVRRSDQAYVSPTWLPDGRIVVSEFGPSDYRLLAVDPASGDATELAPSMQYVQTVAADPSGHHLVLTRQQGDFPENYVMTDGGEPVPAPFSYSQVDW